MVIAQVDSRQWAISARGFNSTTADKLLVLIDGRTVYTPLFAGVFWDVQNVMLEDIDRIEVISGPGASLWGANAVNGVINVISKSARDTQGTLDCGMGTFSSGASAGPAKTSPVGRKRDPWQGQSQVWSASFHRTMHFKWVHTGEHKVTYNITEDDFLEEARLNGQITEINRIRRAIMERNGQVSILPLKEDISST